MKAPEPTPESLAPSARQLIAARELADKVQQQHGGISDTVWCNVVTWVADALVSERERAAGLIDAKCAFVLSKQLGGKNYEFTASVDQNLRMIAVLLPDLAAAIREV